MATISASLPRLHPIPPHADLPRIIKFDVLAAHTDAGAFVTERQALAPPADGPDEVYWSQVRSQFDMVSGLTFLNNGTYCPPPRLVLETQKRWQRHLASYPADDSAVARLEQVRARTARFVNADADEIVLTRSTTEGINLLAHGLDWREGDEILLDRHDHFTAFQSFLALTVRHGVKLRFVDLGTEPGSTDEIVDAYAAAITPRTRLLFVNWVNYRTGFQMPVKALSDLARRHDLLVSVDAAQAFGAVAIDLSALDVDHLVAPSHKWILAGPGTGFAYFSRRIIDRVWPTAGPAYGPGTQDGWAATARKLDNHGPKNLPSEMGFLEALEFHDTIGSDIVRERLGYLTNRLKVGVQDMPWGRLLTPLDADRSSALVSFDVGDDRSADVVAAQLFERFGIKVNSEEFVQLNALRISPHIYTAPAQIDYFLSCLRLL